MNAYEIFKNHHKLTLNEGKFCLFEHIDEEPLFVNNFGIATKLKKYLFTNKLFNSFVNNQQMPNKLSDSEIKTLNLIGPHGVQILLQEEQKLPLLGQLDKTDLKGLSTVENKMYKVPCFYEKHSANEFITKESLTAENKTETANNPVLS